MSDGATLQSLLGPPEGHRQARDEAPAQAEDVRLPERMRREDHHPQNCSPQDYQQVGFFKIRRFGGASRRFPAPSTLVVFLQVPLLPVVPRPPGLQRERHQRPPLQQNPQRVCAGVPDHP